MWKKRDLLINVESPDTNMVALKEEVGGHI